MAPLHPVGSFFMSTKTNFKKGFKKYFNLSGTSNSDTSDISMHSQHTSQELFLSPSYSPHNTFSSPPAPQFRQPSTPRKSPTASPSSGQQSPQSSAHNSTSSSPTPGQPPPVHTSSPINSTSAVFYLISPHHNRQSRNPNIMNEDIERQLKLIDEDSTLSIWQFLPSYNKDKLVREYVEKIILTGFIPHEPDLDNLPDVEAPDYELSKLIQVNVLNNFSTYFQKKNFNKNVQGAVDADHALFKPHDNFKVPHYHQLPLSVFEEVSEAKKRLAINMQNSYLNGVKFSMELLLLQTFVEISEFVKGMSNSEHIVTEHTRYFYLTFFAKAKINFLGNFTIKKIDWSKRDPKNKPALPGWRKNGDKPPVNTKNFYCQDLCKRVNEGKEIISSTSVLKEIASNKKRPLEPKSVVSTSSQGEGHMTVKRITKKAKKQFHKKREGNDKFMKNRNLDSKYLDFDDAFENF